ncbi:hypothetical protein BN1325_390048 [Staphylococcus aureus]|nr:hypothetical protein BN1323_190047 [Staphylococcus aureus]CRI23232.1 hypothetical protein BN1322_400047 [Staphylococcus aureus]CRI28120.1 hypothetical protein BN1325_390048 [Staphylococcus aureus]CRI31339.1 hypothetical protein BN1325_390048 [Staphylococcus aureus]
MLLSLKYFDSNVKHHLLLLSTARKILLNQNYNYHFYIELYINFNFETELLVRFMNIFL